MPEVLPFCACCLRPYQVPPYKIRRFQKKGERIMCPMCERRCSARKLCKVSP